MPTEILYGHEDTSGIYLQLESTDSAASVIHRISPEEKEAGRVTINFNAVNINTGAAADRVKMFRFKKVNGVTTVINLLNLYSNNDTGFNSVDATVAVVNNEVRISITGLSNTTIRHTLHITQLSSKLLG